MRSAACETWAAALEAQASAEPAAPTSPLVLVRRILSKRDPAALAELDAGLVVAARGDAELAEWIDRPIPKAPPLDPLDAAVQALAAASAYVEALPPTSPRAATMLGAAANLAKTVEKIGQGRPRVDTPDEVTRRLVEVRDEAVRRITAKTQARAAKLERDRAELAMWGRGAFGEHGGAELERRVGAMLGAA